MAGYIPKWVREKVSSGSRIRSLSYWMRLERAVALDKDGNPKRSVLDVGCGSGSLLPMLLETYKYVVGIDLDLKYLMVDLSEIPQKEENEAHKSSESDDIGLARLQAGAEYLPFQDQTFDCIYCIGTIEHVFDRNLVFVEMSRCLTPDGTIILGMPVEIGFGGLFRQLGRFLLMKKPFEFSLPRLFRIVPAESDRSHRTFSWRRTLRDLKGSGFRIQKRKFVPFGLLRSLNPYVMVRAVKN